MGGHFEWDELAEWSNSYWDGAAVRGYEEVLDNSDADQPEPEIESVSDRAERLASRYTRYDGSPR